MLANQKGGDNMGTMYGRDLRHALISAWCRHWILALGLAAGAMSVAPVQAQEMCGGQNYPFPFTDVSGVGAAFCPGIMEAYVTGITKGTTATTFSPNMDVTRLQMTTFLQRSVDQVLTRGSRRAALNQWWTPQGANGLQLFSIGGSPRYCAADGENIWVGDGVGGGGNIYQVQTSTGKLSLPWKVIGQTSGVLTALGKVWVADVSGTLYMIDPTTGPGAASLVVSGLGSGYQGIAFDGLDIWTAYDGGSVSKIDPVAKTLLFTVSTGFTNIYGILFDGAHIWVTDYSTSTLLKLDSGGAILQTVTVGAHPFSPVFDGTNIWVPNNGDNSVTVVQASTGSVVATINADGTNNLNAPIAASFDGERILIANQGSSVTLFKAADLSFIANVTTGGSGVPFGACSDGVSFWITDGLLGNLLRF
jgi:hypothetical protein